MPDGKIPGLVGPVDDRPQGACPFVRPGLSNALISFLTFHACLLFLVRDLGSGAGIAQFVGYAAGTVWSFLGNWSFTFRSGGTLSRQAFRFVVLQLLLAGLSALCVWLCVTVIGWGATLFWLLVMAPFTLINFLLCKTWAFAA